MRKHLILISLLSLPGCATVGPRYSEPSVAALHESYASVDDLTFVITAEQVTVDGKTYPLPEQWREILLYDNLETIHVYVDLETLTEVKRQA